jgi:SAM-dependent MidA family methyltransferase
MSDLLRCTRPYKTFRAALMQHGCGVTLVETSPNMRVLQAALLLDGDAACDAADGGNSSLVPAAAGRTSDGVPITWLTSLDSITSHISSPQSSSAPPPPTLFIANEFFDALPVHQLVHNGKGAPPSPPPPLLLCR